MPLLSRFAECTKDLFLMSGLRRAYRSVHLYDVEEDEVVVGVDAAAVEDDDDVDDSDDDHSDDDSYDVVATTIMQIMIMMMTLGFSPGTPVSSPPSSV